MPVSIYIDKSMCEKFGLDPAQVTRIARKISAAATEAHDIGLEVFGGSGSGTLRFSDNPTQGPGENVVAELSGYFDGGDGGDRF